MSTPTSWKDPSRPAHKPSASIETSASGLAESTISFSGLNSFPLPPPSVPTTPTDTYRSSSPIRGPKRARANSRTVPGPSAQTAKPSPLKTFPASPFTPTYPDSPSQPLIPHSSSSDAAREKRLTNDAYYAELTAAGAVPGRSRVPHDWDDGMSSTEVNAAEDNLLSTSFITSLLREVTPASPSFRDSGSSGNGSRQSGLSEMTYPPAARSAHMSRDTIPPVPSSPLVTARLPKQPPALLQISASEGGPTSDNDSDIQSSLGHPPVIKQANFTRPPGVPERRVIGIASATLLSSPSQLSSGASSNAVRDSGVLLPQDVTEDEADEFGPHSSTSNIDELAGSTRAVSPGHHPPLAYQQSRSHRRGASVVSTKSYVTSVISGLTRRSTRSARRLYAYLANKPLPPLPGHVQLHDTDSTYRKEAVMPLPQLINRAGTLSGMLEKGRLAHYSYDTARSRKQDQLVASPISPDTHSLGPHANHQSHYFESSGVNPWQTVGNWRSQHAERGLEVDQLPSPSKEIRSPAFALTKSRKKTVYIAGVLLLVLALALGLGLGLGLRKHGAALPDCGNANVTGVACNMDATCECTATSGCNGLAKEIVKLTPLVNDVFQTDFTPATVFNSFWIALGRSSSESCAAQAIVLDVASGLDPVTASNRTSWAQTAILWNLVQSQDAAATQELKDFVNGADWNSLSDSDGPLRDSDYGTFSTTMSGFTFNFARQEVTQPSVSFISNAQPTTQQANKANADAKATLDRMYSYALASATQQAAALKAHWTNVLQLAADDLPTFVSLFLSADILLPFDAESDVITQLNNTETSTPFPPPLSCYPNLQEDSVRRVTSFESSAFVLPAVSSESSFDTTGCYPSRPVYGVLDVLRLRLPFVDSRTGAPKQAIKLGRHVGARAVIYSGEAMSAMPRANTSELTITQTNPRQFGTLNHYDHVILRFLQSMPDVEVATDFARFLLTAPGTPPSNTSSLFASLDKIPTVEVAVFGTVDASDMDNAVSSLSTVDGKLFFGSDHGEVLRNWVTTVAAKTIKWTESASADKIANDAGGDTTMDQVWSAAATAIRENVEDVGVDDVVASLQSTGKLSAG